MYSRYIYCDVINGNLGSFSSVSSDIKKKIYFIKNKLHCNYGTKYIMVHFHRELST
jgi:hypothetical protein